MVRRVVVGWDGSAAAAGALEWGLRHYPKATLVEIVQVDGGGRLDGAPPRDPEEAAEATRKAHPDVAVTVSHEDGDVADILASRSGRDALIALGGRGYVDGRLGRRSSTAYRVVLDSTGPVVVVPDSYKGGRDIVVGVLGESDADCVVLTAAEEAARRRQRLIAVHVTRPLFGLGLGAMPGDPDRRPDAQNTNALMDQVLAPVAKAHPGLPIVRRVLSAPRPSDILLAEAWGSMLLVLGKNPTPPSGRRPTTHSSILLSPVPVMVVPPETDMS